MLNPVNFIKRPSRYRGGFFVAILALRSYLAGPLER